MSTKPGNPFSGSTPAAIDLIGTLSVSFMTIAAPFSSAWIKLFSPRKVISTGGILICLAYLLASFSTRLWHFELTQGVLLGLGTCCSYMTTVTVAPTWYTSRRGLAMGIILSGTGVGGLVWAPVIQAMNTHLGFRTGLRIIGGISGVVIVAASLVLDWDDASKARLRQQSPSRAVTLTGLFKVPLVDYRVAKSRKFAAQALGAVLQAAAYYIPVFFFATFARTLGYSQAAGANFIAINNACNALGKIAIGLFADKFGRINTLLLTTGISAIASLACWLPSSLLNGDGSSKNFFIAYSILYGTFASAYVSLFPASLVELFGPAQFASVNGVLYMLRGLATLAATPTAGVLIQGSSSGTMPVGYWRTAVFVGVLLSAATVAVCWVRVEASVGTTKHWKM